MCEILNQKSHSLLANDLFDGDQCECEFRPHIARSRSRSFRGCPHGDSDSIPLMGAPVLIVQDLNQKNHLAGGLFDGECPYADPSRTFLKGKSHYSVTISNDNLAHGGRQGTLVCLNIESH